MSESAKQGRRVLLPFSLAIGPPLILLSVLAFVAAQNDEQALRYVEEERTRQAAQRAQAELHAAVRAAEEAVFRTLLAPDALEPGGRPDYQSALRAHPIARRFLTVELSSGRRLWPRAELPFLEGHEEPPRVDPSDEGAALSADVLRKRSELLDYYQRSKAQQEAANLYNAAAGFRTVAESEAADPTLQARAAYRLGTCLERLGQAAAARRAFQIAAEAPLPVRDERGQPVRVLAAIRVAELWRAANEQGPAAEAASALSRALLAGARSSDVTQTEWLDGLTRMRAILTALGETEAEAETSAQQEQVLERVRWTQALDDLIPSLLQQARLRGGSEVRHHALLGVPPRVLAYRVEQGPAGSVVIGFDLDLGRLAREVLAPACATVNLEEEISLAVVDGRGSVRAYAGKDARPGDDGLLPRAAESASVDLVDVPLWAVQVRRSTAQLASARRNRLILYGALLGLTLAAAVTGAIATLRYVRRSLELARMKSDFVSNMTHELKTPLTSIKMYGELLSMGRLKKEKKRKEYAEHIVREADRLQKLIEDVLDFARSDSGQHDYVLAEEDVADTVAEAIDLFRLSAKVRGFDLFVELPPVGELPAVDLDRDAIVRSVLNLLSNAVKYSTDERWIRVSVRRVEDHFIMISVKDRGIGIDPEDLERIFDRFYRAGDELTRAISGAGLGLSLIDQIVRAHGGEIQVESEKGVGSTFRILLPIVEEYRDNWPPEDLDVSDLQSGVELESADDLEEAAAAYEAGRGIDAESQTGKVEREGEGEAADDGPPTSDDGPPTSDDGPPTSDDGPPTSEDGPPTSDEDTSAEASASPSEAESAPASDTTEAEAPAAPVADDAKELP